jgi:hypothetical protein
MTHAGLSLVTGINKLEALFLRLRLPSSRGAEHFAGAFGWGAGGSHLLPLGGARSFGSFRLRCGFWICVTRRRDADEGSELTFLEGLKLRCKSQHLENF